MILLVYLKDNQPKCVYVRLCGRFCAFPTKLFGYQEFRRHELHRTALCLCTARRVLFRAEDRGNEIEICEAGTRRGTVGHEDIRLLNVKNESVTKRRNTDPFEVTVCEVDTVEILETLGCVVQLPSSFSG